MELAGKKIMVSGASRGLGAALAQRYAREGARLSLCARGARDLEDVCASLPDPGPDRCLAMAADVSDEHDVTRWVRKTLERFGRIDAVVNNASILGSRVPVESYPVDEWRRVIEVNLTGPFLVSRAVVPHLKKSRGSLIQVSSGVGDHGRPLWGAYSVTKNGLEALAEILAGELVDAGVRVNAVDPGRMRTGMRAKAYPDEDPTTLPEPEQVTDVFVYLASEGSRGISGRRFHAQEFVRPDGDRGGNVGPETG